MKIEKLFVALAVLAVCAFPSCSKRNVQEGILRIRFDRIDLAALSSKSSAEGIDTNDFLLKVYGAGGNVIYSGLFGDSPENLTVPAGVCNISVRSCDFSAPEFACPLYGCDESVAVPAGGVVNVVLQCSQLNCGMRLNVGGGFARMFPSGRLELQCAEGSLPYSYSERREAYFLPGNVSVFLIDGSAEELLMKRNLLAREMLVVNLKASGSGGGGLSVEVDTSRVWTGEDFMFGSQSGRGESADNAMTVAEARANVGAKRVWIGGYIVGGDLKSSASGISFEPPFSSATNIAIAGRSSVTDKSACLAVQLPSGKVRDALNLVSNPSLIGKQVVICGDITDSYFNLVGIKNVSDYWLK